MELKDYLQRVEFVSLLNFIKNGGEYFGNPSELSYSERLSKARKKAGKFFSQRFTDVNEYDEISGCFYELADVYQDVFLEIGIILGAKIGMQLQDKINELT